LGTAVNPDLWYLLASKRIGTGVFTGLNDQKNGTHKTMKTEYENAFFTTLLQLLQSFFYNVFNGHFTISRQDCIHNFFHLNSTKA
jgi:hypothetical protein